MIRWFHIKALQSVDASVRNVSIHGYFHTVVWQSQARWAECLLHHTNDGYKVRDRMGQDPYIIAVPDERNVETIHAESFAFGLASLPNGAQII